MKTKVMNTADIQRKWLVIDASGKILGRLASQIATHLIGKTKPQFSPNQDHGDNIIVINSDKVKLSGVKPQTKTYFSHSGRPGQGKLRPYLTQMDLDSTVVIKLAVKRMVPKNALGRQIMRKLHVYTKDIHPHAAQKPQAMAVR